MKLNVNRKTDTIEQIYAGVYGYKEPYTPMKADLKGRVALITGASGMIGGATAVRMAQCGADILIWDINDAAGKERVRELAALGVTARYDHVDVADRSAMDAGVKRAIDAFGRIDILHANAGVNRGNRKPITEFDMDQFDINIDLNLSGGSVYLSRLVIPYMIKQGKGSIIFTTSICGYSGLMMQCGFVASKFAISALTRSMALEYAANNIRVNAIAPGSVPDPAGKLNFLWDTCSFDDYDSNFKNPSSIVFDIPARRPGHPTDMAGLVVYLASDDACYTTGQVICVDGGWTAGLSGDY